VKYLCLAATLAGCGTADTRPATFDEITIAILVPYCGRAACHSTATKAHNLAFDTLDATRAALMTTQGRRGMNQKMVVPMDPDHSRLVTVLSDPNRVMPPDVPLPDADIALIREWIQNGAEGL
jgi:hypothetical protein